MTSLYVRIRGRVQGPFDESKLRNMIQKGQLSRVHQVSEDGNSWVKASEYRELFSSAPVNSSQPQAHDANTSHHEPAHESRGDTSPPSEPKDWYFGSGDKPVGPFTFGQIREMVMTGKLSSNDIVWKEGMNDWVPISSIPDFQIAGGHSQQAVSSAQAQSSVDDKADQLDHSMIRAVMSSRPWILFFSITILVFGSLLDVGAIILLLQGFKIGSGFMFLHGISALVWGSILIVAAFFLFGVTSRSYRLQFRPQLSLLRDIQYAYFRFWLYVGIVTIVFIAYLALLIFLAIGFGDQYPYYLYY